MSKNRYEKNFTVVYFTKEPIWYGRQHKFTNVKIKTCSKAVKTTMLAVEDHVWISLFNKFERAPNLLSAIYAALAAGII